MGFYKTIIVFSLFIIGTMAGGTAGKLIAGEGAGLAGGATVFMSMIMGIIAGLILGVFLIRLVAAKHLRNLSAFLALFALLSAGYIYMTWRNNTRMETQSERSVSQKASILYAAANVQMINSKEVEDGGMGKNS